MGNRWWHNATTEQRLAQIDGGIDCGMTAVQIALASGLGRDGQNTVRSNASNHGRTLSGPQGGHPRALAGSRRRHAVEKDRVAYMRGDRVDFFGTAGSGDGFELDQVEI